MRLVAWAVLATSLPVLGGCRSAFVNASVQNATHQPISLVEVDYPSASFGVQTLEPGAAYPYKFKILDSGPVKLSYTDSQRKVHSAIGPVLSEGLSGSLTIQIEPSGVHWETRLH